MPQDPGRVGWSALYAAAAYGDLCLSSEGKPSGLGTVVSSVQALFTRNTREAEVECDRTLDALPSMQHQLDRLRGDADELERRVAGWSRALLEAGRHPDRELRLALGRFAARVLVEDLDAIEAFELGEVIARMTALDYALLEAVHADAVFRRKNPPSPTAAELNAQQDPEAEKVREAREAKFNALLDGDEPLDDDELDEVIARPPSPEWPRFVVAPPEEEKPDPALEENDRLIAALSRRFPLLKTERAERAASRLQSMQLVHQGVWSKLVPTTFGQRVLEVTRKPAHAEDAVPPDA